MSAIGVFRDRVNGDVRHRLELMDDGAGYRIRVYNVVDKVAPSKSTDFTFAKYGEVGAYKEAVRSYLESISSMVQDLPDDIEKRHVESFSIVLLEEVDGASKYLGMDIVFISSGKDLRKMGKDIIQQVREDGYWDADDLMDQGFDMSVSALADSEPDVDTTIYMVLGVE